MSAIPRAIKWLYNEFGLASVYTTGRDAWLIIFGRTSRMFAFGAASLIIAQFFSSLGFTDFQIGLFMTLTLGGDVLLSLTLTLVADRIGRRRVLLMGAVLMVISGFILALSENFVILLMAAIVGIVSATGGDFGPFRAIEESTISHLTTGTTRSDVLSWYVTTSSLGSAAGTEFSGRIVDLLSSRDGWTIKDAYHSMFWLYIAMGALNIISALSLSDKCELNTPPAESEASYEMLNEDQQQHANTTAATEDDSDPDSLDDLNPTPTNKPLPALPAAGATPSATKLPYFAQISRATRAIMYKLWFLLVVDSLADGMTSLSLTYYYMDRKFTLSKSFLGDISSTSYLLASCSTIFAGPLARRLGLINTMVFTHLPSSAAVLLFPIGQSIALTVTLFFIRTGLNNMDQAPRAAFIAAVVKPEERTAVMGITSMLRTLASTLGPSLTGWLAGTDQFWIAFVVAGALRIAYDLGLFALFVGLKVDGTVGTNERQGSANGRAEADEEGYVELDNGGKSQS